MANSIWALDLLKFAVKQGYTIVVDDGEGREKFDSAIKAWELIKDVGEAGVHFKKEGEKTEWAYLMVPGVYTCDNNESVVDHSCNGFIEAWWKEKFEADMRAA